MAIKDYTRVGTDVRKIARLLQAKAPEGHMLAYITPEEAQVLKDRGGSGKPHEDTGIPSFEGEAFDEFAGGLPMAEAAPTEAISPDIGGFEPSTGYVPPEVPAAAPREAVGLMTGFPTPTERPPMPTLQTTPEGKTAADMGKPTEKADTALLKQLGATGLSGLVGALTARRAAAQGAQAKQELSQLGAPYQQMGQQLQAQAQRGELTPAGQQALQAAQAQLQQGIEARGGVGVAQASTQIANLRNALLQQQMDYGLKLANIGDQYVSGAIKTGLQADQYVNNLTSSFFGSMARLMGGTAPQLVGQQPTTTPG